MMTLGVPLAAQERLRQLHAVHLLTRRDLFCFVEGVLLGMGLNPDEWDLDIATMALHQQEKEVVQTEVYANGTEDKRRSIHGGGQSSPT